MKPNTIMIDPKDNVAIALRDIPENTPVVLQDGSSFSTLTDIPYSHKFLLANLGAGDNVIKYGEVIGQVNEDLQQGEWIHTHNLVVGEG